MEQITESINHIDIILFGLIFLVVLLFFITWLSNSKTREKLLSLHSDNIRHLDSLNKLREYSNDSFVALKSNATDNEEKLHELNTAFEVLASIESIRGEFMYNMARKMSDTPPKLQWYYEQEKKTITERLQKAWNIPIEDVEKIIELFYTGKSNA